MAEQSAEVSALIGSFVRGIFIGCPDTATGRRLCHQLLRDAWQLERSPQAAKTAGRGDGQFDARDALDGLEVVLVNIKGHMGANGAVRIEDARRWLRDKGEPGRAVASMVGKLSKLRNTQAHPLAHRILEAIQALVAADHPKGFQSVGALSPAPNMPPSAEDDDEASTASSGQAQDGKLADAVEMKHAKEYFIGDLHSGVADGEATGEEQVYPEVNVQHVQQVVPRVAPPRVEGKGKGDKKIPLNVVEKQPNERLTKVAWADLCSSDGESEVTSMWDEVATYAECEFVQKLHGEFGGPVKIHGDTAEDKPNRAVLVPEKQCEEEELPNEVLSKAEEEIDYFDSELHRLMQLRSDLATKQLIKQLLAKTAHRLGVTAKELLDGVREAYLPGPAS
jgi:hypothetical protein